ncbi:MAG TPA: glycosyltransferase, partial [Polyangiales bacterium]
MRKFVGSWRAPGVSVSALAETLRYVEQDRVLLEIQRGPFAGVSLGLPREAGAATAGPVSALLSGEILGLSTDQLVDAYARDPSCSFLANHAGVFAGVLFDEPRQRLLLFSDALGLGQLFYGALPDGGLLFATEQKVFARVPGQPAQVRARAVDEFLRHGHLVGDTTWLEDVQLVKPGEVLAFGAAAGQRESRIYFDLRHETARYGSYNEAKRALVEAYGAAFQRAVAGVESVNVLLSGDLESRLVLATSESRGLRTAALTEAAESSDDALFSQHACAVGGTIQHMRRPHASGWLLTRAALGYIAEGVDLATLDQVPLCPTLGQGHVIDPSLGQLLFGSGAIRGFDDRRASTLAQHARRQFAATRALGAFSPQRFPFADPELWRAALRLDVAYLLDGRLRDELALELFPAYFARIPVVGSAALAAQRERELAARADAAAELPDPCAYLRADAKAERFLWQLLSDTNALYGHYVDAKVGHRAFWSFFQGGREATPAALLRCVSLELWLRQLLRGEFLQHEGGAPRVEADQRQGAPLPVVPALVLPALPTASSTPDVSVIVPAYNVEPYLAECLNSLCNQELTDIEILVVDDGSTDGTLAVLQRFAAADPRIQVIESPNAGVYHARNLALSRARGRYISFVDADDYVHPAMLRLLLEAAEAHRAEVTFCDVYQFDVTGAQKIRRNTLRFKPGTALSLATAPGMIGDGFSTLWNRLYDHAFLRKQKLRFNERYRISADMLFLQELLPKVSTIVRVPRGLYFYRFATPKSLTSYEVRNANYLVHLEITIELVDFWVRNKLFDRYAQFILLRALRNFLWNTHIDEQHLREVFQKFHEYVRKLRVTPVAVAKLPPFERHVFQLVRAGDYGSFGRYVRPYRAKMIAAKGGELTRAERLQERTDRLRARVRKSVRLRRDREAGPGRFRLLWPAAQLGLTLDRGAPASGTAPVPDASAQPPAYERLRSGFRGVRQRLYFEADLDKALTLAKAGAPRILHFSNAFSVPSETFTYDVISGLEATPDLDNYVMCFDRQLARERPYPKVIELHGATRADLEVFAPVAMRKIERVLSRVRPSVVHCHFGWVGVPLVMWLAQRGAPRPVVITMHGTDVNMWPARHSFYADALKTMADKGWVHFTTHTETYREKLVRLGVPATQIDVIPNSFD